MGLLALLVLVGAGCGDDPLECTPDQCPLARGVMPDRTLEVDSVIRINVKDYFVDADSGDITVYTAESEDQSVVTVEMTGAVLAYTGVGGGQSEITVTATDQDDCGKNEDEECSVEQKFTATVNHPNRPPACPVPPAPVSLDVGTRIEEELVLYCFDPDGDALTFSATSSDPGVVSVSVSGSVLTLEVLAVGTSTITVSVTDPEGLSGTFDWLVTGVEAGS